MTTLRGCGVNGTPQPFVVRDLRRHRFDKLALQAEVDKARPGYLRRFTDSCNIQLFDNALRQRARVGFNAARVESDFASGSAPFH